VLKGSVQAGVRVPRREMLLDPALVLGLPGQSSEMPAGLQAVNPMQGEILPGDIHLLVLTTAAS